MAYKSELLAELSNKTSRVKKLSGGEVDTAVTDHEGIMAPKSNNSVAKHVAISAPNFQSGIFHIVGTAPLVIHRFSAKTKKEMLNKMIAGSTSGSKGSVKKREALDVNQVFEDARYRFEDGSDGFHAAAIRNAMISACRLVGYKMTIAKMSVFVEADGYDKFEPQIPLIRIIGKPVKQEDMARVETGQPYVTIRAAFHKWAADVKLLWDGDQFTYTDIANLLSRVGIQVGLGEGRPDSKDSAGMGWGLFKLDSDVNSKAA